MEIDKTINPDIIFNEKGYPFFGEFAEFYTEVKYLSKPQKRALNKMLAIAKWFLGGNIRGIPFRGFLLEGPPSSGKTYLVFKTASLLARELKSEIEVYLLDSSKIASPRWGEAENKLSSLFESTWKTKERKKIIMIDDIDCLMIRRGTQIAKEWHYAINSVLFHLLDRLNPNETLVIATTNRSDLIDDALRSRLYSIKISLPPIDDLEKIANYLIDEFINNAEVRFILDKEILRKEILSEIKKLSNGEIGIREIERIVIDKCISYIESKLLEEEL